MQIAGGALFGHCTLAGVSLGAWVHRLLCKLCVPTRLSSSGRRIWELVGTSVLRAFAETPCGDLAAGVGVLEWHPLLGLGGSSLGLGEILAEGVRRRGKCARAFHDTSPSEAPAPPACLSFRGLLAGGAGLALDSVSPPGGEKSPGFWLSPTCCGLCGGADRADKPSESKEQPCVPCCWR